MIFKKKRITRKEIYASKIKYYSIFPRLIKYYSLRKSYLNLLEKSSLNSYSKLYLLIKYINTVQRLRVEYLMLTGKVVRGGISSKLSKIISGVQ